MRLGWSNHSLDAVFSAGLTAFAGQARLWQEGTNQASNCSSRGDLVIYRLLSLLWCVRADVKRMDAIYSIQLNEPDKQVGTAPVASLLDLYRAMI